MSSLRLLLVGLAALAVFGAPDGRPKQALQQKAAVAAHTRKAAPAPVEADSVILGRMKAKLAKSKMASSGFQVRVENGTVIIDGKTDVMQRKGAMTRMAKKAGARNVQNNIQISEAARAKLRAQLAKGRHRDKAKRVAPRSIARTNRN